MFPKRLLHRLNRFRTHATDDGSSRPFQQGMRHPDNLRRTLCLPKDDFWHAFALLAGRVGSNIDGLATRMITLARRLRIEYREQGHPCIIFKYVSQNASLLERCAIIV